MKEFDSAKLKKKINKKVKKKMGKVNVQVSKSGTGAIYFFGFIGAAVYYVSTATDFWAGVLGIIKAAVWPAFLVFEALSGLTA